MQHRPEGSSAAHCGLTIRETHRSFMALSNSERQKRYRKRRLGVGGKHERITCLVSISTKRNVERLAFHFDCTITEMIERLINEKTADLLSELDEEGLFRFFTQGALTEDA